MYNPSVPFPANVASRALVFAGTTAMIIPPDIELIAGPDTEHLYHPPPIAKIVPVIPLDDPNVPSDKSKF
jgi:hypothetical protein